MELHQLNYLLTLAEEKNFTRAAEKLFVSQPALTQQIQKLESEVGTVLLDRTQRRLTPAGEILCHHARHIFQELEDAKVALDELQGLQRGSLTIGTVQTVNDYLIPQAVARFAAAYPAIKVSVREHSADEIEQGLADGQFQIGLGFVPANHPHIETELLFEEDLVLIVGKNHPLADCEVLSIRELDGLEMVQFPEGFCTRRLWQACERTMGIQTHIIIEMNSIDGILAAVAHSKLAAVLPRLALDNRPDASVTGIYLTDPTPRRGVGLLRYRGAYQCAATRAFTQIVRELIQGNVHSRDTMQRA